MCYVPPSAVSNLDVESKLTSHYRSPWLQQRNVLRPSSRPACVVDLHRQAGLSLWTPHRGERRRSGSRERRVTISIPPVTPMPSRPPAPTDRRPESPDSTAVRRLTSYFEEASLGHRHKSPVPNPPTTLDRQTNWSGALPLPTPEERMKTSSLVVPSCVIPINVTGVGFDRDASVRCSLVHSQSLLQRRRKLRRRRTVAGVPRQVQRDLDSDGSPGSRERAVVVRSAGAAPSTEELDGHPTRDSGCQTEDFLVSGPPSRRRIRSQRGQAVSLSVGDILFLSDDADAMFTASVGARLRSRSLPRDGSRATDDGRSDEDDDEEEEEEDLSPFDAEDFLPRPGDLILKDGEESVGDRAASDRQLKYKQLSESPERSWMARTRSRLPRKTDMGSCEISSSSDTFSSPVHSVSAAGVRMDHKEDHQSSSGNWSGSSSTCPSQTSETIPPAASPPLTGSSHCDSELSLNAAAHHQDDHTGFLLDHYQGLRTQRAGSFSSTAMDILEEAGVSAPMEEEWNYPDVESRRPRDFSPEPNREVESSLGCPSFTSMATCESSFSDKPPSEKADAVSHYSVDTEGYYTSMHFDCGIQGSRSFSYGCESDFGGHMTLGRRCLSLRKPKAKPSPPKRSSSLRKICSEGHIPDDKEPNMSSKERKLQLVLSNPVVKEPLVVWGVEGFANLPDLGAFGATDARSFKDEGVVQSDYADLWLLNDLKSSDPYRSLSNSSTATGTTVVECVKSQESSGSQSSQSGSRATTPSLPPAEGDFKLPSPEKLTGLTSPSSGYSSQSETPTSSFPSAFFPGPLSPSSGKRKPKVPERKSSLSSLSLQPLSSSRRDLELPIIPPSHLDFSALPGVCVPKSSASRTQIQFLHQNKLKPPVSPKPAHPMFITPTALQSVQLRSIGKGHEERREDKNPPAVTENLPGTLLLCGNSAEFRSPSHLHRPPSDGSYSTAGDNLASPLVDESRPEEDHVFLSPTKARTTEDLFAMIHRSKRKVLGRKDSTEPNARNRLAAAPGNTPPGSTGSSPVSLVSPPSAVTPPGLHRVSGAIFRSAKKSSTSNEEFKLLLLKKGSRSETSYRMSATEILKSPVAPKSPADSPMDSPRRPEEPDSPLQHQSGPDRLSSPYPKANAEGFSPKSFPSSAASRQGRPRIPPPANSSRYGARGRLYPAPMQAISEGEAENSDGSPQDDRSPRGST
uniref:NHS actin remodeling regulator n=1 Tax=Cyclopterus lumpus TaxID=8103 RepID=A0A8C3A0J7_CYCLU